MSVDDVAAWLAGLEHLDGEEFELQPWQAAVLETIASGRPFPSPEMLELRARQGHRRQTAILSLVAAAIAGETITVVCIDAPSAEQLLKQAEAELERTLEAMGRPVPQHARDALHNAGRPDDPDRPLDGVRSPIDHDPRSQRRWNQ